MESSITKEIKFYTEDNMNDGNFRTTRGYIKSILPPDVHLPNKNESAMLRKIKVKTGLTEEEIRKIKKYRILLSEAQDKGEKGSGKSDIEKAKERIMKSITKELKLAKEHPLVIERFNEKWNEYSERFLNKQ